MLPRGKLDIGWRDLAFGVARCLWPPDRAAIARRIEARWSPGGEALICLSVRSGFDLLWQALALAPGDDVLVSAVTIRDMTRIIESHGLVPRPVDLDMATLSVSVAALERAATPRTRAILVAHLFGSRMPLDETIAFAHGHDLLVIEDCAQAYVGDGYRGHPGSDVVLFSFGPIKTNTALAGGIVTVKNAEILGRMRSLQDAYPVQSRAAFLKRLVKYAGIKALTAPPLFALFAAACRRTGRSHDAVISAALRGFPGPDLFAKLRRRPPAPLLALLDRRLQTFDRRRIDRRIAAARAAIAAMPDVARPGARASDHAHWIFPVQVHDTDLLMHRLWEEGFDATRGASSLSVVDPPESQPDLEPAAARRAMRDLLYLPVYPGVSRERLARLARTTNRFAGGDRAG